MSKSPQGCQLPKSDWRPKPPAWYITSDERHYGREKNNGNKTNQRQSLMFRVKLTASSALENKPGPQKGNSSSNHWFSGAIYVSCLECIMKYTISRCHRQKTNEYEEHTLLFFSAYGISQATYPNHKVYIDYVKKPRAKVLFGFFEFLTPETCQFAQQPLASKLPLKLGHFTISYIWKC